MNKQQKIITSIVGITIVLLALLGITYAYYLTRIEGNTNTNSISITTADLKLVYGDGNGHVSKENIMPGTTIEKTFTVTNDGNNKVDNYAVYLEELTNTLTRTEDLTYKLECTSNSGTCNGSEGEFPKLAGMIVVNSIDTKVTHTYKLTVTYKNEENIDQSDDMGSTISAFVQIYALKDILDIEGEVTGASEGDYAQINSVQKRSQIVDGKYKFAGVLPGTHTIKICGKEDTNCTSPKLSKQIVINLGNEAKVDGNTITITDDSQTATIAIDLTETVESNKVIIGTSIKDYIPFKERTLAYMIVNNAKNPKDSNSTIFSETPLTSLSTTGGASTAERILSIAEDDYTEETGIPSYYFRGKVKDNYVTFNNMCWRIVRVQGDGSVKLILSNISQGCSDTNNDGILDGYISIESYKSSFIGTHEMSYTFNSGNFFNSSSLTYTIIDYDNEIYGDESATVNYTKFSDYSLSLIKDEYYSTFKEDNNYYDENGNIYNEVDSDANPDTCYYTSIYNRLYTKKEYTLRNTRDSQSKSSTLTPDEIVFAGRNNSYLEDEGIWIELNDVAYVYGYGEEFYFNGDGSFNSYNSCPACWIGYRPVITLVNTGTATGDGTINNPYVIN